jgi:hypothetical protein
MQLWYAWGTCRMQCIFCHTKDGPWNSVEHIIPESLGGNEHTLPKGYVCDKCNNYFARKVEEPFLNSSEITNLRFHEAVVSKNGRIPSQLGILSGGVVGQVTRDKHDFSTTILLGPKDYDLLSNLKSGSLYLPFGNLPPANSTTSRFVAKVAVEAFVHRLIAADVDLSDLFSSNPMGELASHARRGQPRSWPISIRRIYEQNKKWDFSDGSSGQLANEFDFLCMETGEVYFAMAIFGVEYVINLGGPSLDGFSTWLSKNGNESPLYCGKNGE